MWYFTLKPQCLVTELLVSIAVGKWGLAVCVCVRAHTHKHTVRINWQLKFVSLSRGYRPYLRFLFQSHAVGLNLKTPFACSCFLLILNMCLSAKPVLLLIVKLIYAGRTNYQLSISFSFFWPLQWACPPVRQNLWTPTMWREAILKEKTAAHDWREFDSVYIMLVSSWFQEGAWMRLKWWGRGISEPSLSESVSSKKNKSEFGVIHIFCQRTFCHRTL